MIKAFLSGTLISLGIAGMFQGQSSANMEEPYENDKCQYVFEGDYCMAPNGSIWFTNNVEYNAPRSKQVGVFDKTFVYYFAGLRGYLQMPSSYHKNYFKYNDDRTTLVRYYCKVSSSNYNAKCSNQVGKSTHKYLGTPSEVAGVEEEKRARARREYEEEQERKREERYQRNMRERRAFEARMEELKKMMLLTKALFSTIII